MRGGAGGAWSAATHAALYPDNINSGLCRFLVEKIGPTNFLEFGSGLGLLAQRVAADLPLEPSYCVEPEIVVHSSVANLSFINCDVLTSPAPACLDQKFDLVMSIEVIEHIPRDCHEAIFDFLAARAGRWVVFSAARPGQGGHGHIAERPEQEWREEWTSRGFQFSSRLTAIVRNMSDAKNINHRRNLLVFTAPPGFEALDRLEYEAKPYLRDLLTIIQSKSDFLDGSLFYVDLHGALGGTPEYSLRVKRRNLMELATKARNVLEIGFNGGHSALLILLANPQIKISIVDLFTSPYAEACFDYLNRCFPGRLVSLKGDSRDVLPRLSGQKFDLVHVDGGKELTLKEDLCNVAALVEDDHALVIDDTQNVVLNNVLKQHEDLGVVDHRAFFAANATAESRRWKHKICRFTNRPDRFQNIMQQLRELFTDTPFASIYTPSDATGAVSGDARAKGLVQAFRDVEDDNIAGAFVEVGVAAGHSSLIAALAASRFIPRDFWLFDTYEGFTTELSSDDIDLNGKSIVDYDLSKYRETICGVDAVRSRMLKTGVDPQQLFLVQGPIEQTARAFDTGPIAILRLDVDLFAPTVAALEAFYDRLVPGGWLIVDDYGHWQGCRKAVDEYFAKRKETFEGAAWDYTCYAARKRKD